LDTTKLMRYLGLCRRAGGIVRGTELIEKSLRRSPKPVLVLLASDASPRTTKQITDKCRYAAVPLWTVEPDKFALAACAGASSPCAALAVLAGKGPADAILALYRETAQTYTEIQENVGLSGQTSLSDNGFYDRKDD